MKFRDLKLDKIIEPFKKANKGYIEDLQTFKEYIYNCISEVSLTFNWDEVFQHKRYQFSEEKINLFRELLARKEFLEIFANTLIALILTEICHISENPEENLKLLEFLLNRHGLSFIANIPSLYDKVLSLGPFQLTDLVVNPDKEKFYPINFMNNYIKELPREIKEKYQLPDYKIPESLENFGVRDHFRGEILLLIYYLLELFKDLDASLLEFAFQEREWLFYQISYYLAGSHHLPDLTKELFREFFNEENISNMKGFVDFVFEKIGKEEKLSIYLKRFRNNLKKIPNKNFQEN